jgi:hypothetical protein
MKYLILAFAALAAGAEAAAPEAASPARLAFNHCVFDDVAALDDGVSPVADVATAVQSSCAEEYMHALDAMALNAPMRAEMERTREKNTRDIAMRMVLIVRSNRRAALTASAPRSSAP